MGGFLFYNVYDNVMPGQVKVEQYITNADVIAAQRASKEAKSRGERPMNDVEAYMMDAPEIEAKYVSNIEVFTSDFVSLVCSAACVCVLRGSCGGEERMWSLGTSLHRPPSHHHHRHHQQ